MGMSEQPTQSPRERLQNRRNSVERMVAGGVMLGTASGASDLLDERLHRKSNVGSVRAGVRSVKSKVTGKPIVDRAGNVAQGFSRKVHLPHVAGKAGVRAVQVASFPLIAGGVKHLVTGEKTPRLNATNDVLKPVARNATLVDTAHRASTQMSKALDVGEQERLSRHKQSGRAISLVSGTLGLSALAARTPQGAKALASRGVKSARLAHLAAAETKATHVSNTLGVGAIGVGSLGSFNYAAQQKLERKRDESAVAKAIPMYARHRSLGVVKVLHRHSNTHFGILANGRQQIAAEKDLMFLKPKRAAKADAGVQEALFEKSFLKEHSDRLSPEAEAGYRHLRYERNENIATATGNAGLAGLSGWLLHHEAKHRPVNRPAAAVTAAATFAAATTALRSGKTAVRRDKSMNKIENKARARAMEGVYAPGRGKFPVDATSVRARKYPAVGGS